MGISDDISPKRSHHRTHSYIYSSPEEKPIAKTPNFVEVKKEETKSEPDIAKNVPDLGDEFFANNQRRRMAENNEIEKDQKPSKKKNHFSGWILLILLLGLSGFLVYQNFQKLKHIFKPDTPTSTTTTSDKTSEELDTYTSEIQPQDYTTGNAATAETATTGSTATASTATTTAFDKTALKIQVLNGNGVTGSAVAIKKTLETAGFKVASTANAGNFAYATTFVYYKTGQEEGANLIKTALPDKSVTVKNSDTLVKTYDIVVIVGKK